MQKTFSVCNHSASSMHTIVKERSGVSWSVSRHRALQERRCVLFVSCCGEVCVVGHVLCSLSNVSSLAKVTCRFIINVCVFIDSRGLVCLTVAH